ncbi:MAG: threonine synthase [Elusimicrobia bacterium]|nr:threonine synthase [Elusimicrobiota bacterium]MBP9699023.1 threonine synthase [Elusimicrobiota bacterium]
MPRSELIQRYRAHLPVSDRTPIISLLEGDTPLIASCRVAEWVGAPRLRLFLKYEGLNPTGSFKDRGMTLAISKAAEAGSKAVITASTGNTSASAAAYAARAGMRCVVLIPDGQVALGKLSQALIHGAEVFAVQGNFDDALTMVRRVGEVAPITVVNSINPYRIESQKTGAFEIVDQLGQAPDYHFIPVGNAGNITAYWKGYKEYHSLGKSRGLPKMIGWQAEGAAPIVKGEAVKDPKTIATAIKIGNPASWKGALAARDESGGHIGAVSDDEILEAYKALAREGVFCEPASAASVAGVKKFVSVNREFAQSSATVVCVLTGHGLKDPERAIALAPRPKPVAPTVDAIRSELGL